jgi:dipeptidyl aminopeptidase/acylaminoacyl peptidase
MGRLHKAVLAVLLVAPFACGPAQKEPSFGKIVERSWEPMQSTEYRMATAKLGAVPNSGLLLPVVSPDGQWVACLQAPLDNPPGLEDLVRGDRCERNSLLLRQTAADAPMRVVSEGGVTWAAWTPDSATLVFTTRAAEGRGELGLYDLAAKTTQRRAVGPKRLAMPAVSPTGDKIALVDADNFPASSRIYVLNTADRTLLPGPPPSEGSRQLWPRWTDAQTLVFLDWGRETSSLRRWTVGGADVQTVAPLGELPSVFAALQLFVSVPYPVSPDGKSLLYYDRLADRLAVLDLTKGTARGMGTQTRAGCWMGTDLLGAADKDLFLFSAGGTSDGSRMLRGQWLPLWAQTADGTILLATRGATDDAFNLVRVYLVWHR